MAMRDWRWPQWTLLAGVVLLVIVGGVLVYVLLNPTVLTPQPTPGQQVPIGGLPTPIPGGPQLPASDIENIPLTQIQGTDLDRGVDLIASGGPTRVDDVSLFPTQYAHLSSNGSSMNYYDPDTKRFYRIDANGTISKIGQQVFAEVQNVVWAPNNSDAIVEFPDSSNIRYNFDTNEQVTLPSHWDDFGFSPSSSSVAFKSNALDPDERWLATADASGGNTRRIIPLGENGNIVNVDWPPNNQVVGTYSRPDGLSRSDLYFVGFNGENFPLSKLNGLNFEGRWTPDGQKVLYSVAEQALEFRPRLWITDGIGETMGRNRQPISLSTWPHKCTFSSGSVAYCGVPVSVPAGAGLIPSVADSIPDDLYKVDTNTGAVTKIASPATQVNVESLQLSEDGKTLFIHDSFTGAIKKMQVE